MNRLLSPNEAKFWLLDANAPMNSVVVIRRAGTEPLAAPKHFAIPQIQLGAHGRPRWADSTARGVLRHVTERTPLDWLAVAQELLDVRVGTGDAPPWHAVDVRGEAHTTLVLAVNHALTDWRTSLTVGHAFLDDTHPGELAPPCEEMLPDSAYGDLEAGSLLDGMVVEPCRRRAGKRSASSD